MKYTYRLEDIYIYIYLYRVSLPTFLDGIKIVVFILLFFRKKCMFCDMQWIEFYTAFYGCVTLLAVDMVWCSHFMKCNPATSAEKGWNKYVTGYSKFYTV